MKIRILKSKITRKKFNKFQFERILISKTGNNIVFGRKSRVFKAQSEESKREQKQNITKISATVGYCSIKNFDDIVRKMSNIREQFALCLNQFIEAISDIISSEGGCLLKFLKDGIYFYFPSDKTSSNSATKAAVSSLKMRYRMNKLNRNWGFYRDDSWLISIGVATGTVLIEEIKNKKDVKTLLTGQTAELARGMGSSASSGKVLISDTTYNDAGFKKGYFVIEEPYHMQAEGINYMTKVYEITGMVRGE
jgi:class 3 adenylate cyclase